MDPPKRALQSTAIGALESKNWGFCFLDPPKSKDVLDGAGRGLTSP